MGVLDAWAYGIPCVVTPVGGIPDIVENGKNGLIFQIGDSKELAQQLENMITNKELRRKISKESLYLAQKTFNISTINKKLEKIYQKINQDCNSYGTL